MRTDDEHADCVGRDLDEAFRIEVDVWAVVCNYREHAERAQGAGAAYVGYDGNGSGYVQLGVVVCIDGDEYVKTWELCARLTDFRADCIPLGHPVRDRKDVWLFPTQLAADSHAIKLMKISRRETGLDNTPTGQTTPRPFPIEEGERALLLHRRYGLEASRPSIWLGGDVAPVTTAPVPVPWNTGDGWLREDLERNQRPWPHALAVRNEIEAHDDAAFLDSESLQIDLDQEREAELRYEAYSDELRRRAAMSR